MKENDMKEIETFGTNRFTAFSKTRYASRAVIVRDGNILLSHENDSDLWLISARKATKNESRQYYERKGE